MTCFSHLRKRQILILFFFSWSFVLGLACISCSPKSHCANASTRPGRVAPVWAASLLAARKTSTLLPTTEPGLVPGLATRAAPGPKPYCGGRGGGRNPAAATWAPSACSPHPLFPTGPGSGSSFCESPRRGGQGARGSYFRAIRAGGRRGRGVEVEAAQKAQCLLLFHPTEGSICGSEQTLGIRAGRGQEKEKKKKATSTTTHRSSPELSRGGE